MQVDIGTYFLVFFLAALAVTAPLTLVACRRWPALAFGFMLLYVGVSILVSLVYLEGHAVFITEASTVSSAIGATWRFLLFNGALIAGLLGAISVCGAPKSIRPPSIRVARLASAIISFVLLTQLANLALSSSTALPGIGHATRFNFWQSYAALPILETLYGVLMIFVPFVSSALLAYASAQGWRTLRLMSIAQLAVYFICEIAIGQVFHGLLLPATIMVGIYVARQAITGFVHHC